MRIPLSRPSIGEREVEAVRRVFASGWLGEGRWTSEFEQRVADYTGARHVVAVNTGTSALHLALDALGIGPGDEVIVPSLTFVSDPVAVRMCGAIPVFADIDPLTLNLDPADVASRITSRTRAIMPTDYAGVPADVPALRTVTRDRDIRIIRDAAHSFGSQVDGRPLGAWLGEDATCFSFDPIKNVTCVEGGAVAVNDDDLAAVLREKRTLGFHAAARTRTPRSSARVRGVTAAGFRYHMSNVNAAIGLAQFEHVDELLDGRRAVARQYDELLADCRGIHTFERDYDAIVPFIYPVIVAPSLRDPLIAHFAERGIHADLRYSACHQEPLFAAERSVCLPVTERVADALLCLPIYVGLEAEAIEEIVLALMAFVVRSQGVVAGMAVPE